jgi:putative inorganic carbon (hco3(-)) transporter
MGVVDASPGISPASAVSTTSLSGTSLPVLIFVFAFYTNLSVVAVKFHGVPQSMGSAVILLLLLPVIHYTLVERKPLVLPPALPFILLFLSVLFLAAVLSGDPEGSRGSLELYLSEGLLLFFLVVNAIRTPDLLTKVVSVLLVAGAFLGALSLIQEVTGDYQNAFGGFAQVDRLDEGGNFDVGAGSEKQLRPRLGGPIGSENRYAQILLVLVPLALYRVLRDPKRSRRIAAGVAGALILSGIALTFSRGAAVGLAVVRVLMAVLRELRLRHLVAAAVAATLVVTAVAPEYVTRLASLGAVAPLLGGSESEAEADGALRGRQTSNLAAWYTFADHPIVGVGPGQYFREFSQDYANRLDLRYFETDRRAHNMYLELAADAGILGLIAFAALIGITLLRLHRLNRKHQRERPDLSLLAGSFFFALVAYLATAVFLHLSYQRYFWVVVALANTAIWIIEREPQAGAHADGRHRGSTGSAPRDPVAAGLAPSASGS